MRIGLLEKQNPFIKGVPVLLDGIILVIASTWKVNLAAAIFICAMLVFFSKCSMKKIVIFYGIAAAMGFMAFVTGFKFGRADVGSAEQLATMNSALNLGTRVLVYIGLGIIFALTTDAEKFILSMMHQAHFKPKFAYGILAAFHLLPTLSKELEETKLAYRVRGKSVGLIPFGPMFNALINGIRWSESVAMAMESKGFDGDGGRTYYEETVVTRWDIIAAAVFTILCILLLVFGKLHPVGFFVLNNF